MAQDAPPAFGQGYPHGSDGQEPAGYEYQQSWYPQQPQTQPEPYGDGQYQQQPWQWQGDQSQQQVQQQPEPVYQAGYYAPYPGDAQPETGYQSAPGYEPAPPPSAAEDPIAEEPTEASGEPETADPSPRRAARSRGAGAAAGASASGSVLDRAKAAAGAVLSSEQTPDKRALLIRTAAGVAALGVLVTAGYVATRPHSSAGAAAAPTDTGFAVAHSKVWAAQPAAAAQPGADDTLVGSWLLSDAVVRADSSGVHAYDLAAGKPTWSVAAPSAGAVPCGLSPTVNAAGLGGVLFRPAADPNSPCTLLSVVDSKTGKTAWTKTLSGATGPYAAHVAVTDDKVVAVGDDKAIAWAAADGKDAWQYAGQGKFCSLSGSASGATVLVHSTCADSTPADQAVALSVAEGKVLWWRGLNNQPKTVTVLSAEPAVVLTTGDKPTDARVFGWGPTGDPAGEIPVAGGGGRLDVAHGSFDAVPGVFFQGHTMTTTVLPDGSGPAVVASYDLSTGKQLWQTPVSEKGAVSAVGIDNGALVLAADERVGQPAHLSRFALTNGQEDVGGGFPPDTGSLLGSGRVLTGGGKVIVVPTHSSDLRPRHRLPGQGLTRPPARPSPRVLRGRRLRQPGGQVTGVRGPQAERQHQRGLRRRLERASQQEHPGLLGRPVRLALVVRGAGAHGVQPAVRATARLRLQVVHGGRPPSAVRTQVLVAGQHTPPRPGGPLSERQPRPPQPDHPGHRDRMPVARTMRSGCACSTTAFSWSTSTTARCSDTVDIGS